MFCGNDYLLNAQLNKEKKMELTGGEPGRITQPKVGMLAMALRKF